MLEVRELTVRYGDLVALDDVSLEVDAGETVAVLGASGSGKTTLLRAIAGLLTPDAGTISWDGADLRPVPAHRRRFGLVFQDFALFPHLDVAGNVGFGLRMSGVATPELAGRVDAALARVLLDPRMLLLDEPLGSLDPALRRDLATDLAAALAADPIPTLLVTHDTDEAFALAGRVAVMDGGRIVRTGTPEEVWRHPGTAVVARLLGQDVVAGPLAGITPPPGGAVAVRTDALRLDPNGSIEATVLASAFRGPDHVVTVDVNGERLTATSPTARRPGDRVRYAVDPEAVSVVLE